MSTQRTPVSASRGAGVGFGAAARVGAGLQNQPSAVAPTAILQQVLGSNVSTFSLTFAAFGQQGATEDIAFTNPLGIPAFTLEKGARALIIVTLQLTEQGTGLVVSFSQQLAYGGVAPQNVWTIPPGGTFAGGKVVGTARALALAATSMQTLTVLCNAHAYGIPPPASPS